jgi:hypothetical protein
MASFNINGLHELVLDLEEIARTPQSVIDEMLREGATVAKDAQARHAASMLQGPYYEGVVAANGKIGEPFPQVTGV